MDAVLERIAHLPGVVSATPVLATPFSGPGGWDAIYNARSSRGDTSMARWLNVEAVGPSYFQTLGIALRRGRSFTDTDRNGAERVVIVSEAVARHYWPNVDPIGQEIGGPFIGTKNDYARVVGIAPDTRYRDLRLPKPTIYFPHRQFITAQPFIIARTTGDPYAIVPSARKAVAEAGSDLLMWRARSMTDLVGEPLAQPRLSAGLLVTFGASALLLAAFGLYAVTATALRSRTRELGIRLALGATPSSLHFLVIHQAATVIGAGVVLGLMGAMAGMRLLRALVFDVSPTDPTSIAAVTFILVVAALIAAFVPARRAARVDPVRALRAE